MNILSIVLEKIKASALFHAAGTGAADYKGLKPVGSNGVVLLALVTMANAADLALSVVSADDADGLNPVAITENVPIFVDNVRESADAKSYTITAATGTFLVAFCVPAVLIPAGKYLCLSNGVSHADNVLSAIALNDAYHTSGQA